MQPFIVRCYDSFQDPGSPLHNAASAPENYSQYAIAGRRPLDLVLQFRSASGDVPGYLNFTHEKLTQLHRHLYSVQITEEPNFVDGPNVIDGPYPNVKQAVVEGVIAAKETLHAVGRSDIKLGFNTTPTFGKSADFWSSLKDLAGPRFFQALDYVGIDFFPDVFRRVAPDGQPGDLVAASTGVLETLRNVWLPAANISDQVPIHITEHGWPTGATRSEQRQAEVLDTMIRTVERLSARLNISRYMVFALRDVDHPSGREDDSLFRFFGITAADYRRKPAFATFREAIREFGSPA